MQSLFRRFNWKLTESPAGHCCGSPSQQVLRLCSAAFSTFSLNHKKLSSNLKDGNPKRDRRKIREPSGKAGLRDLRRAKKREEDWAGKQRAGNKGMGRDPCTSAAPVWPCQRLTERWSRALRDTPHSWLLLYSTFPAYQHYSIPSGGNLDHTYSKLN